MASFGFNQVIGTATGPSLSTDVSPEAVEPSASRKFVLSKLFAPTLHVFAMNGTTITGVLWFKESTTGKWFRASNSVTATPTTPGSDTTIQDADNAEAFFQITANTGVTYLGVLYH